MSLFMMKVRLGLAAGSASGGTLPRPVSQYDASPLTPPSSDCGGDLDDVQAETVTSGRRDVLSESQQVRGLQLYSIEQWPSHTVSLQNVGLSVLIMY